MFVCLALLMPQALEALRVGALDSSPIRLLLNGHSVRCFASHGRFFEVNLLGADFMRVSGLRLEVDSPPEEDSKFAVTLPQSLNQPHRLHHPRS